MDEPADPRWKAIFARLNLRRWKLWWPKEWYRRLALVVLYVLVPALLLDGRGARPGRLRMAQGPRRPALPHPH